MKKLEISKGLFFINFKPNFLFANSEKGMNPSQNRPSEKIIFQRDQFFATWTIDPSLPAQIVKENGRDYIVKKISPFQEKAMEELMKPGISELVPIWKCIGITKSKQGEKFAAMAPLSTPCIPLDSKTRNIS